MKKWHLASWPLLAWLETAIKLIAIAVGIWALSQALSAANWGLSGGIRTAQFIILGVMALGLLAAIADRWIEREIVAMVFVVLNNLGHWGMLLALAAGSGPGVLLTVFAGLMLAGDLVKLVFLRVHEFTVRDTPQSALYGLTLFYVVGYVAFLVLELLR